VCPFDAPPPQAQILNIVTAPISPKTLRMPHAISASAFCYKKNFQEQQRERQSGFSLRTDPKSIIAVDLGSLLLPIAGSLAEHVGALQLLTTVLS
jgi:hypothetical protein